MVKRRTQTKAFAEFTPAPMPALLTAVPFPAPEDFDAPTDIDVFAAKTVEIPAAVIDRVLDAFGPEEITRPYNAFELKDLSSEGALPSE